MHKRKWHQLIRKSHRYLGLFLGIQFFLWTLGGLYFSWTNIEQIRGEDIKKADAPLWIDTQTTNISSVLKTIQQKETIQYIKTIQVVQIFDSSYYQIVFYNGQAIQTKLANTQSGQIRNALTQQEAISLAQSKLIHPAAAEKIEYLTVVDAHHEYREKPLPAYAITFKGNIETTVYVASENGTVQSFRNTRWRIFDFLWMLHTMDYKGRDNMNNLILRTFSILGLITIISGFLLYFISYKKNLPKRKT